MEEPATAPRSVLSELLDRRRLTLVLVVLVAEFAIFLAGLLTPVSITTQQNLANETSSQYGAVQTDPPVQVVVFIFSHNLTIALAEMIPVFGALLFAYSVYVTGLAAQAISVSRGLPGQWGAIIFAFPFSLVELSAYAVAVGAGAMLLLSWRRKRLRREIRVFALEALVVAAILLVAAAMETATIRISFILGLALWLPTGLALATVLVLSSRNRA